MFKKGALASLKDLFVYRIQIYACNCYFVFAFSFLGFVWIRNCNWGGEGLHIRYNLREKKAKGLMGTGPFIVRVQLRCNYFNTGGGVIDEREGLEEGSGYETNGKEWRVKVGFTCGCGFKFPSFFLPASNSITIACFHWAVQMGLFILTIL